MGFKDVEWYVYKFTKGEGVRTNCPPEMWKGKVGKFLDTCPAGMEIGFNIENGVPVEKARASLSRYTAQKPKRKTKRSKR